MADETKKRGWLDWLWGESQAKPMEVEQFTQDPEVVAIVRSLHEDLRARPRPMEFSDVLDAEGNQYVDLVLQGGGVLGVALVGYTYVLEEAGLRFRSVAGTSAGAINAVLIAALGEPSERRSLRMLEHLANLDFSAFLDGPRASVSISRAWVEGGGLWGLLFRAPFVLPRLRKHLALHPGDEFERWLRNVLDEADVTTLANLHAKMQRRPEGLTVRGERSAVDAIDPSRMEQLFPGRLAMIAADVTTKTKIVFPKMAALVYKRPDAVHPAEFVRASMAIPGFFEPVKIPCLKGGDRTPEVRGLWKDFAGVDDDSMLDELDGHVLVDGGVISNFPIAEFHNQAVVPLLPTFGARLGPSRVAQSIDSIGGLMGATFDSARQALDFDFLHRNPDYRHLIARIDTGDHSWLDFDMTPQSRLDLFRRGVEAGARFLQGFDWSGYKKIREPLAQASRIEAGQGGGAID